jgi:Leucine-rich repeat (LRR) protein
LTLAQPALKMRVLRASSNRLRVFDASPFPCLRTLLLDGNTLERIDGLSRLRKLENISVRRTGSADLT